MREYVWYSPEIDAIVFQTIMENCTISFEWSHENLYIEYTKDPDVDPMSRNLWVPLGEL